MKATRVVHTLFKFLDFLVSCRTVLKPGILQNADYYLIENAVL